MPLHFPVLEVFRLMRRKGVYPYEYMNGWKKFEETSLPPKDAFYSKLNMKSISDQEYEHAQQVWNMWRKRPWAAITIPT